MLETPEYTVELWSLSGVYVADVSDILTSGLRINFKLNDVESVDFTLDLVQFEAKCARIGAEPRNILDPYRSEVRIRRNDIYIVGAQVVQVNANFNNQSPNSIEVRCTGYLNFFKDRYITPGVLPSADGSLYSDRTYAQIAWQLIEDTQSQDNGDFGVTLGVDYASPDQAATRTRRYDYDNQNVKDGIINLTKLEADNFEFRFEPDKTLNFYTRLGSDMPEIELVYPQNISSVKVLRDASTLANRIIGYGSGIGDERISSVQLDFYSSTAYKVRERIELFNSVSTQETLDDNTEAVLYEYRNMYEIPSLSLHTSVIDPNEVKVGDAIYVRIDNSTFISNVNGMYRILEMDIDVGVDGQEDISIDVTEWA